MQFLSFLFFSTLLMSVAYAIRITLTNASDRIEAALAGDHRLVMRSTALPYRPRRRRSTDFTVARSSGHRLAA